MPTIQSENWRGECTQARFKVRSRLSHATTTQPLRPEGVHETSSATMILPSLVSAHVPHLVCGERPALDERHRARGSVCCFKSERPHPSSSPWKEL